MRRGPFFAAAASTLAVPCALSAGANAMADETLTHLDVFHLPDSLSTRTQLTPQAFEAHAGLRRTALADAATIAQSLRRLKSAGAHAATSPPDVRWGLIYHDASGARRRALYLDKFGKRGIDDGRVIALAGESLVQWLREKFGA